MPSCHLQLRGQKPPQWPYPRQVQTLGDRIRDRRLRLGLTQNALAALLSVNVWTVRNWESNATRPHQRFRVRLDRFLGQGVPTEHAADDGLPTWARLFRQRRNELGITQRELVRALGIDRWTVGAWETGNGVPQRRLRVRLAGWLGVSASQLGLTVRDDPESGVRSG